MGCTCVFHLLVAVVSRPYAGGWWLLVVVVPKDSFHLLIDGRCTTPICVYVVWVDGRCIACVFHLLVAVVSRPYGWWLVAAGGCGIKGLASYRLSENPLV